MANDSVYTWGSQDSSCTCDTVREEEISTTSFFQNLLHELNPHKICNITQHMKPKLLLQPSLPARQSCTNNNNNIPLLSSLHSAMLPPDDEGKQDLDFDMQWIDSKFVIDEDVKAPEKKIRTGATANPLLYWGKDINMYLLNSCVSRAPRTLRFNAHVAACIALPALSRTIPQSHSIASGTTEYPRSGATFALLEFFQLLSFMSKISALEFYQTLLRQTDNTSTVTLPGQPPQRLGEHPKPQKTSTDEQDLGLNHGYAYFVNDTEFKRYLTTYGEVIPDDISTCNNHDAIKSASIRGGKGIDTSGTGKTEYVNMDYFFLSSMGQNPSQHVVMSYNIACQWGRNLAKCCTIYPPNPYTDLQIHFLVPKFHLPAHRPDCHFNFSFNYTPGVGQMDGEAPEHGWAAINVTNSTKEMGLGSQRNTLDNHFGDYNWRKIVIIVPMFSCKLKEAVKYQAKQVEAFETFNLALPVEDPTEWTHVVQTWEADGTQPNPFMIAYENVSESHVQLELAKEDEAELCKDLMAAIHEDVPSSQLIAQGLELEDHQAHLMDLQHSKILEHSNCLLHKPEAWAGIQVLYMPSAAALRAKEELKGGAEPSMALNFNLWLLSAIIIEGGAVNTKYLDYEWRLRTAQAHATLLEVRQNIILRLMMFRSKDKYIRGQRLLTRNQALLLAVKQRIKSAAKKYNKIRAALKSLNTATHYLGWDIILKELNDGNLHGLTANEGGFGEGRHNLSWIWSMYSADAVDGEEKQEALRIKWCKARAWAHQCQEECLLLDEEMH
ncbi:hypothetical protein DXG01_003148 [Tephrocybe rancida]|nr:hypothetical protein DXG01_003148 [Tephrocybe rancida]